MTKAQVSQQNIMQIEAPLQKNVVGRKLFFLLLSNTFCSVFGVDWPWNWKKEDVKCYSVCLAAVGTGAVVGTPLALAGAGFGAAGVASGSIAAKLMSMIGVVNAGSWFAFLQSAGVSGVGLTGKMIIASTISPLCHAVCGSSDERQDLKCYTQRRQGMKGLDEFLIKAEPVTEVGNCEKLCDAEVLCKAFRFIRKNKFCFLYSLQQQIEDDVESLFFLKRCTLCYMEPKENSKGPDDEVHSVTHGSSLEECEKGCIKSSICEAVHFDGKRCFAYKSKVKPVTKDGNGYSAKTCVEFSDMAIEYEGDKYSKESQ